MTALATMIEQIADAIAAEDDRRFLPVGGRTKPALCQSASNVELIDMTAHRGIITYDPSEFLISARAGTPVSELQLALAEHGQYLPCDPLFGEAGATVGGTLASGISGSNRLLYGSLRDFIMEVELIDGTGTLVRGGGKVVKNAAGFDIPKLMVGSYGRLGIITEVTFKVFPKPRAFATSRFACQNIATAIELMQKLLAKPLPIAALDLVPYEDDRCQHEIELLVRCGAPPDSVLPVIERIEQVVGFNGEVVHGVDDAQLWDAQGSFVERPVATDEALLRIAIHPAQVVEFDQLRRKLGDNLEARYTGGCSAVWLRSPTSSFDDFHKLLVHLNLSAIVIMAGDIPVTETLGMGSDIWRNSANRIQQAIDPRQRFLAY